MSTTRSRPRRSSAAFDEDAWRATHPTREYVIPGLTYEDYAPAYRYGMVVADKHGHKEFVDVEPLLAEEWAGVRGASPLDWAQARPAVQDGYAGVVRVQPVKAAPARRPAKARAGRPKAGTRRTTAQARAGTTRKVTRRTGTKTRTGGDNLRKRGPQDRARVNVHEPWEVDYWCERLGVTPAQLRQAVKKAGPMAKDVRRQLKK